MRENGRMANSDRTPPTAAQVAACQQLALHPGKRPVGCKTSTWDAIVRKGWVDRRVDTRDSGYRIRFSISDAGDDMLNTWYSKFNN